MQNHLVERNRFIHNDVLRRGHGRVNDVLDTVQGVEVAAGHHDFLAAVRNRLQLAFDNHQRLFAVNQLRAALVRVQLTAEVAEGVTVQRIILRAVQEPTDVVRQELRGQQVVNVLAVTQRGRAPQGCRIRHAELRNVTRAVITGRLLILHVVLGDLRHLLERDVGVQFAAQPCYCAVQVLQPIFAAQLPQHGHVVRDIVVVAAVHPALGSSSLDA